MVTDIYKYAAQKRLRFSSGRGELLAEDLYDLNLPDLDRIAKIVNKELKASGEESFIPNAKTNPKQTENQVRLDILKNVIQHKVDLQKRASDRAARQAELAKLKDIITEKAHAGLREKSLEDLQKMMAELGGEDENLS